MGYSACQIFRRANTQSRPGMNRWEPRARKLWSPAEKPPLSTLPSLQSHEGGHDEFHTGLLREGVSRQIFAACFPSAHDCVCYLLPVRQLVKNSVGDNNLADDEWGKHVKIYLVDVLIDNQVAYDTKNDQQVDSGIKKLRRQQSLRETPKRRRS